MLHLILSTRRRVARLPTPLRCAHSPLWSILNQTRSFYNKIERCIYYAIPNLICNRLIHRSELYQIQLLKPLNRSATTALLRPCTVRICVFVLTAKISGSCRQTCSNPTCDLYRITWCTCVNMFTSRVWVTARCHVWAGCASFSYVITATIRLHSFLTSKSASRVRRRQTKRLLLAPVLLGQSSRGR
jgi:hypothetical protein